MNKLSKSVLPLLVAGFLRVSIYDVEAIPINGSINFSGTAVGTQSGGTSTLTFNNPMLVTSRTGDYAAAGVPLGTPANWAPISWTGSGTGAALTPGAQLEWQFTSGGTTFQFTLIALQSATMTSNTLTLAGSGILTMNGAFNRDPTNGSFSFQATGNNFTFRIGQAVPESGSTIRFLPLALAGLELLRRRARSRSRLLHDVRPSPQSSP